MRVWRSNLLKKRNFEALLIDLTSDNLGQVTNFCRMSMEDLKFLLTLIGPDISREDTSFKKAITAKERMLLILRFFAMGDSYASLKYLFKISTSAIIPELCTAIIDALKEYVQMPKSLEEWLQIARGFEERWNYPNCLGAIDGKHCVLQAPANTGRDYFNYKSTFSVVLLGVVDCDYNFLFADVGCQGCVSDGGVFSNTSFCKKLQAGTLGIPENSILSGRTQKMPYVFIANDVFALHNHLLKPYGGTHEKNSPKRIFNYRPSGACSY